MMMSLGTGPDPNRFATKLFNGLPLRYDRLGYLLSMGQDRRWRSAVVDKVNASPGESILDVATGTAGVALALRAATGAEITVSTSTPTCSKTLDRKLMRRGESGVRLVQGRAEDLPFADDTFDDVTFTYLLRYVSDPAATVAELARVLKPVACSPAWTSTSRLSRLASPVVVLHPMGLAYRGVPHRWPRVVRRGTLPRSQHRRSLLPPPTRGDCRVLESGRDGRCSREADVARGRPRHVGHQGEWWLRASRTGVLRDWSAQRVA